MIENFTRRIAEKAQQREKDEQEELWQWLGDMIDQARAEGKDLWQWLDEQEEKRQWQYQPDDISQQDDYDFWQRIDELAHDQQQPPWSLAEMSQEDEQALMQFLNDQDREQPDPFYPDDDTWQDRAWPLPLPALPPDLLSPADTNCPRQDPDYWQWLAEQEKEWQEHTCSDEEAAQEEDSWYRNGWWLNEEDLLDDEDSPWDEL